MILVGCTAICQAEEPVDYNRDIRPLFSNTCYECHGPDSNTRETDLRLDQHESVLGESETSGGKIVAPHDSAKSELYRRLVTEDVDERMPPEHSRRKLNDEQIQLIKKWIDQGAPWREHWSFVKPQRPTVPEVSRDERVRNAIDAFIQQRLEKEGLIPAEEADPETLIRRATLDLTGLPPTVEEIDAFLADKSPGAYERVVDRLLKSQRYGEHMARYWLDLARYGDTHGLHLDNRRQIWPYRDWVIKAFNQNMPFDQFTIEQLAGDLLPNATTSQKVATGFNRCNVTTSEGGSIAEEYRVRYAVDRVETTSTVWMGLTAGCAVCHEHKFDPISQKEFYELYAYFYSFAESPMDGNKALPPGPTVKAITAQAESKLNQLDADIDRLTTDLAERSKAVSGRQADWEAKLQAGTEKLPEPPADMLAYYPLDESKGMKVADAGPSGLHGSVQGSVQWDSGKFAGAIKLDGKSHVDIPQAADFERTEKFSYGAWVNPANNNHMAVLARMDDGSKYRGYDLYLGAGKVYVHIINTWDSNAIRLNTKTPIKPNQWTHLMMTYDGSSKAEGVRIYVNGQPAATEITHNSLSGSIKTNKPLRIGRRNPGAPYYGLIDDVRIYQRQLTEAEVALIAGSNPIQQIVALPAEERTAAQKDMLREFFLSQHDPEYKQLTQKLAGVRSEKAKLESSLPETMVMGDKPQRLTTYVLTRGEYDKPDKSQEVQPAVPDALPPLPKDAPQNRLGFARWLVDRDHPLTARVTVNRFWQQLFGTGIVKTSEDFGSQGQWPSHPKLLDWLAVEFMESGWDVKHMMKRMVMSHTYRQSAKVTPELLANDKDNRLLARGPRYRMDAEMIRDSALFVSGLLVEKVGGPSVRPYQPDGLWKAVGYSGSNTVKFTQDHGESLYRRSMYIFWKRTAPPPAMQIFDAPSREYCVARRERTNTPSAALVLMNDIQFVEAARNFAQRLLHAQPQTVDEKLILGFRMTTARRPTEQELTVLRSLYTTMLAEFQADREGAQALTSMGESPRDNQLDVAEFAAWTIVASSLLNLDETVTKG